MKTALIGITACRKIEDYRQSILHAGGQVRVLDASIAVSDVVGAIDGLLLTGGKDLAPAQYGEPPHPTVVDVAPDHDRLRSRSLLKHAAVICRFSRSAEACRC